jgi:KAP family P-loop domain
MNITVFEEDLLDLRPFSERLQRFIDVEHQFVDGSLVIALSSKFGSGKTTFFQMWKADLESRKEDPGTPLVISLNAWESDYYGDPLFAIISGLVDCVRKSGESADSIVDAAKDIGWFATAIGGQLAQKLTGIDPVAAGALAEGKKVKRGGTAQIPTDTFSVYQGRKDAMGNLKAAVLKFVTSSEPRVLFLVDELDRCRPDYAIAYLETIKHIFDVQGAVFILAADRQQLENSAKTAFGPDLDFEEYYRKFVHREISLPPISKTGYRKIASTYVNHYLQCNGQRHCFMKIDSHGVGNITVLVGALGLTPRQIQEMFRILGHIFETSEENTGRLRWCLAVGSVAMAAFKVGNPRVFHALGNHEFDPAEAFAYLTELLEGNHIDWWFKLFLSGGGLKMGKEETEEGVMISVGLIQEGTESGRRDLLGQWHQGWGYSSDNRFAEIHEKIEQILNWN